MSEQSGTGSRVAVLQKGSVVFAAGMALAAASLVIELAILRMFGK